MKLTFVSNLKLSETQEKIIREIKWLRSKVYNAFNYSIREGKVDVSKIKRVNEDGGKIYKSYRKENWHSKYLHSHTLQQIILNCIRDHKSYLALKEMYEEGNKDIKEKPQMPIYKNNEKIINANINGSLNILRKYIKEIFSPDLEIAMDIGREQRPLKKRVT